jgi:hypothetical protein
VHYALRVRLGQPFAAAQCSAQSWPRLAQNSLELQPRVMPLHEFALGILPGTLCFFGRGAPKRVYRTPMHFGPPGTTANCFHDGRVARWKPGSRPFSHGNAVCESRRSTALRSSYRESSRRDRSKLWSFGTGWSGGQCQDANREVPSGTTRVRSGAPVVKSPESVR